HFCASLGFHEPFALDPIQGLIERAAEAVEQFVDLRRRDDQRRTDRYDIADEEAHDQSLLFGAAHGPRPDPSLGLERTFGLLVGDKLAGADEPQAASLPDQGVLAERGKSGLELRRLARGLLGDALARIDVERLERHRRRDRMTRIGEAMAEGADLAA